VDETGGPKDKDMNKLLQIEKKRKADEAAPALYRRAGVRARADSPSVAELEADGWTVEHIEPRYGTALMRREDDALHLDEDEVAARLIYRDVPGGARP
jgi:hypothetical protein